MKKILLLTFILLLSQLAFSQANVYRHFPDSNAAWRDNYENGATSCSCVSDSNYAFILEGDTVIGSNKYHKIVEEGTDIYYGSNINYGQYHKRFFAGIREDTAKHVYLCCTDQLGNHDTLLYDFNMKVGDTLHQYNSSSFAYNGALYVTSIDSVQLLDSTYRKAFWLNDSNALIIEGIGSVSGLLEPIIPLINLLETEWNLNCFKQNNKCLYSLYGQDTCPLFDSTVGIANVIKQVNITTYPNPACDKLYVAVKGVEGSISYSLYDMVGREVMNNNIINSDKEFIIPVKGLSNGLYMLSIHTLYGSVVKKIDVAK
jgi:hypothetical protein